VPPVCSNCGAGDFVWANDLKTGGAIGGGTLSLRSRGELSLGTRICRSCGHADLFLKDPSILHAPHTWRPGEFVPIQTKTEPATHPGHGSHHATSPTAPTPPSPTPAEPILPQPLPPTVAESPPPPPPEPSPGMTESAPADVPAPADAPPATEGEAPAKRPARRRSSRNRSSETPPPPPE
jgi:hypothetical protein